MPAKKRHKRNTKRVKKSKKKDDKAMSKVGMMITGYLLVFAIVITTYNVSTDLFSDIVQEHFRLIDFSCSNDNSEYLMLIRNVGEEAIDTRDFVILVDDVPASVDEWNIGNAVEGQTFIPAGGVGTAVIEGASSGGHKVIITGPGGVRNRLTTTC